MSTPLQISARFRLPLVLLTLIAALYGLITVAAAPAYAVPSSSSCDIQIQVWDSNNTQYSNRQVGCAVGHYTGNPAGPVGSSVNLHAYARLDLNGTRYAVGDSPSFRVNGCNTYSVQGFNIGVCVNNRGTGTTAYPDIYVNSTLSLGSSIASIATSQVGYQDSPAGGYCNKYSAYWGAGSSCSNGNMAEEWCSDFAAWTWRQAGAQFVWGYSSGQIDPAAASFYTWAKANGTWHAAGTGYTPRPGDAVVYGLNSTGSYANHVAIVTSYTPSAAGPNVVNGDWWLNNNGSVAAESDQTTSDGSDSISGYASPLS